LISFPSKTSFLADASAISINSHPILNKRLHCQQFQKAFQKYIDSASFYLFGSEIGLMR